MHAQQDGVVAYPVMQVYGSLALEEVGEAVLGRCRYGSISCVCFLVPRQRRRSSAGNGSFRARIW